MGLQIQFAFVEFHYVTTASALIIIFRGRAVCNYAIETLTRLTIHSSRGG